jgi:hypothetical protein
LLSPSVATQSDALPEQLQQWPCKKSKLARSGYESTSAAVMPPTAHRMFHDVTTTTAKANGSRVRNYVGCNEQDGQAFSDQRERRGRQSISWNHQKKAMSRTASSHQQPSFCKCACQKKLRPPNPPLPEKFLKLLCPWNDGCRRRSGQQTSNESASTLWDDYMGCIMSI